MRLLRFGALIAIAAACGPRHGATSAPTLPPEATEFPALRFVPDKPTYILTAKTVRDAQRGWKDTIESFGMVVGVTTSEVSRELEQVLAVDPLSVEGAAKLGVDPDGGLAMFSEATDPTFVVHLAAPEAAQAFFDHLRDTGLRTQSVIVDGTEINTAVVVGNVSVSWSIDKDWLWAHFAFGLDKDPAHTWFTHARHPAGTAWRASFGWATKIGAAKSPIVGFFDSHALIAPLFGKAPHQLLACAARFDTIRRVGFTIEGDGHHVGGRIALDLGPAAHAIAAALRPPPAGFDAVAAPAPLAVQWNLDLGTVAEWLQPCAAGLRLDLELTRYGVRTGRIAIQTLDPDDKSGTGVVAFDLLSKQYFSKLLDEVPRRSMFESERTYGTFAGHRLKIPFIVTLDYVLDDHVALAGMGDGLLDKLVMGAAPQTAPIVQIDVAPTKLSPEAWQYLIGLMTNERYAKAVTEHLVRWHDGHIAASIDRETLVIEASGNRR